MWVIVNKYTEYDYDLELYPRDGVELDDEDDGSISGRMKKIVTGLTPGMFRVTTP